MKKLISIMILGFVVSVGYPYAKVFAQEQKPLLEYVENLQQAKNILRPDRKWLMITRDPFDPIIVVVPRDPVGRVNGHPAAAVAPDDQLNDVRVIGIVRLEKEYRAYVAVGTKYCVVNLKDTIRQFHVTTIDMDQVVFKSGSKEIIKKRGKL